MTDPLIPHLVSLHARWRQLAAQMEDPAIIGTPRYQQILRDHARLGRVVDPFIAWQAADAERSGAEALLKDPEMRDLAREEIAEATARGEALLESIRERLATSDDAHQRNAILEIRAGIGGDEAALFAGDLARLYTQWCVPQGLRLTLLTANEGEKGGFKEITFQVTGTTRDGLGAYGLLRFENGGHRVQRVPETEAQGRVHTSAATVAVLPEAEEADVTINTADLDIDTFKASGAGGQHVNKTESAIRITHRPTGVVVACSEERSQGANKDKAMKWLRARLYEAERERLARERAATRKDAVGTGERSDRIRTYNFPQNRITDHRINWTGYSLDRYMDGGCDELLKAMAEHEKAQFLATWDGTL